jgi:hypothetical protein
MRSMFNSAPFSRFDLGRHILGQAQCPPGTIPLLQNNKIICVEGFAPGSMMSTAEADPKMSVAMVQDTTTMMGQVLPPAPVAVPAVAPVTSGISTMNLLVGGAVALGLGLLLFSALGGEK